MVQGDFFMGRYDALYFCFSFGRGNRAAVLYHMPDASDAAGKEAAKLFGIFPLLFFFLPSHHLNSFSLARQIMSSSSHHQDSLSPQTSHLHIH
jgi:hypothetical protein